ncbi:unnamed protein product [Microthlaspi erraticum]|uniref:Uncharacterized protein n=1 Tax=Microthlaspi erraticum TaxID=1685480 RepID=A0A6D2L900_9BRAS|nr:unnamed protein product [Microthlaspi erraticum]
MDLSRSCDLVGQIRGTISAEACFPDRPHGRSVPIHLADRGRFFRSRALDGFVARCDPAERPFLPGSTVRSARLELLGQNFLRVRGQCFGADCVFTPFSPSILS